MKAVGDANAGAAQKDIADRNALLAGYAATDSIARGELAASKARMQAGAVIGEQRAQIGASGVEVNSGTALEDQATSKGLAELDAQTIRNNAAREAWGFKNQRNDFVASGQMAKARGESEAAGTILTGVGNAARGIYSLS